MTLPESGDLFPTEYAELLVEFLVDNFEDLKEEYGKNQLRLLNRSDLKHFRFNLFPDLLNRYVIEGTMKKHHEISLISQMASVNPEDWFLALSLVHQFRKEKER